MVHWQDGDWLTSEYEYLGFKYVIKSRIHHGMKSHIFNKYTGQVIKTLRYSFITPDELKKRTEREIEIIIKKLQNEEVEL